MNIELNKIYDLWYFNVKPKHTEGFDEWIKKYGGHRLVAGGSPHIYIPDEEYLIIKLKYGTVK